jgi:putative transposase
MQFLKVFLQLRIYCQITFATISQKYGAFAFERTNSSGKQLTMSEYRRSREPGGTYFFTIITFDRAPILTTPESIAIFRLAWNMVRKKKPFKTVAICVLPDHIHTIWRIPEGDADFSMRWKEIKRLYTKGYLENIGFGGERNNSRVKRKEVGIWQRRFWEHTITDENDLNNHIDYIHFNPVKNGLVKDPTEWPWSSFRRYVKLGFYPVTWGGGNLSIEMEVNRGE